MINGAHILLHSPDADADRAFIRDVLGFRSVDAGHGWLIFALPPAELAVHPGDGPSHAELYLMCDDLHAVIAMLAAKQVTCSEPVRERWGVRTTIPLPSGAALGLYQPSHPVALGLNARSSRRPRPKPLRTPGL
jgi:catechol 2,3-dioxygenase-like lactoylglutathione lyase family enzyme